ncbi:MAG: response regulator [Chloroflexales bacterium]|nr:response regulator [Chloroflexales bacterium]
MWSPSLSDSAHNARPERGIALNVPKQADAQPPQSVNDEARILIVEDHTFVGEALMRLLQMEGHRVELTATGSSALDAVRVAPPDLILLDMMLPDMDGKEVCSKLKSDESTRLIPILIISACDERESQLQVIAAGADGYLRKPVDMEELRARIQALVRTKRRNDTLESAENVIFALAAAVEAKDSYTEGHIQRLGHYATAIGECMGLVGAALTALRYGALLHDVGKIGIDEAIIRKQGPLTRDEYRTMQQHTLIGARIVAPLRLGAAVGPIVRSHHEHWDGTGYPDRLAGARIPLGARIVSVVDAYDAMTTQRPYNRVRSEIEALACLHAGAGVYWDPRVVAIFIAWAKEYLVPRERTVGI